MDTQEKKMRILMLPWLAHGHASPYLELSKRLIENNFLIYFCSTPILLASMKKKLNEKQSISIKLVELHLPSSPELPPHRHSTKEIPNNLIPKLKDAFALAAPSFSLILEDLKPEMVIYDGFQPWAPTVASLLNIPAVHWYMSGAITICYGLHMMKYPDKEFPCKEIKPRYFNSYTVRGQDISPEDKKEVGFDLFESVRMSTQILILKTFKELEGEYIDYLSVVAEKKVVQLGTLIESPSKNGDGGDDEIMTWLDKKDECSTVFVSFGSECFLAKEEIKELALGLELSNVNFLWVIRFPIGEEIKINDVLPEGFLERVGTRGKVCDWAPQLKILAHSSIGGFVSHCGWGSVSESLGMGVPIIAVPMQADQPYNSRLVEEVGFGIEVPRYENDGAMKREEIAKTIRKILMEKDGESVRKKARELSDIVKLKEEELMGLVVKEFTRICKGEK